MLLELHEQDELRTGPLVQVGAVVVGGGGGEEGAIAGDLGGALGV